MAGGQFSTIVLWGQTGVNASFDFEKQNNWTLYFPSFWRNISCVILIYPLDTLSNFENDFWQIDNLFYFPWLGKAINICNN